MMKKLLKVSLLQAGLVLVVGLGPMAYFFIMGRDIMPADDSDLRIVEPPVPDSENMYVAFLAVTNLYSLSGDDATICTTYRQWRRDGVANVMIAHTNEWRATVDRVLAAHAPYFAGLHKAVALPGYHFVRTDCDRNRMAFSPFTDMMRANNMWTTKVMREIDRCDYSAALETIRDHFAFGRKLGAHAVNCVQLFVGLGITDIAYWSVRSLAACEGVSEDVLSSLAGLVRDEFDVTAAFAQAIKGDYTNVADALRDKKVTTVSLVPLLLEELEIASWFDWMPGYRRFSLQPGATQQLLAEEVRLVLKGEDAEKVMSRPRSGLSPNWAGRMVASAVIPVRQNELFKRHILQARFARVLVAAQQYRHKQGSYPSTLGALVPAYLGAVPRDPFAADAELRYDAAKGVMWSVGENGYFNPFPEKAPHNIFRFEGDLRKYAMRLDGKPFKKGKLRIKKDKTRK